MTKLAAVKTRTPRTTLLTYLNSLRPVQSILWRKRAILFTRSSDAVLYLFTGNFPVDPVSEYDTNTFVFSLGKNSSLFVNNNNEPPVN